MLSFRLGDMNNCFVVVVLLVIFALLQFDGERFAAAAAPAQRNAASDGEMNGYERLKSLLETLREVRTKYHQLKEHQNTLNDAEGLQPSDKRNIIINDYSHPEEHVDRSISGYSHEEDARESARKHKFAEEEEEKDLSAEDARVDELRATAHDVVMARIVALLDKATSEHKR